MKPKNKTIPVLQKSKNKGADDHRLEAWRRILPRLVAIFLIIVFLAGECSVLIPEY